VYVQQFDRCCVLDLIIDTKAFFLLASWHWPASKCYLIWAVTMVEGV